MISSQHLEWDRIAPMPQEMRDKLPPSGRTPPCLAFLTDGAYGEDTVFVVATEESTEQPRPSERVREEARNK